MIPNDMIEVYDDFLTTEEIKSLYDKLWNQDWYLNGYDSEMPNRNQPGWSFSKTISQTDSSFAFYKNYGHKILELDLLKDKFVIHRTLTNAYKFGDVLKLHVDGGYDLTAIIYGNEFWDINWGSETIFASSLDKNAEIIASVIPKPGRLVIFDSKIPHSGRVPNSLFPNYRYSLVFNLSKKKI